LDAADCVDKDFWRFLRREILREHPNFFFLGEIIHGDYREWANAEMFDSTTNYVAYKGLWSSLNDRNYFEIAYTLDQQFDEAGAYRHLPMYNFLDNHDVNRIVNQLHNPAHLPLAYAMLFTIPGFPSLYYGSEIGIRGARDDFSDKALRPFFDPSHGQDTWDHALLTFIQHLSQFRKTSPALQFGNYRQILLASEQFVYLREIAEERILVVFNASDQAQTLTLPLLHFSGQAVDLLDASYQTFINSQAQVWLPQNSVRILQLGND
jgi:glycosidase